MGWRSAGRQTSAWAAERRRSLGIAAVGAVLALAGAGCALLWRPTTVPLRIVPAPGRCASRPDTLLVLLPGSWSLPEDFQREGFVAAARQRHLAADLWLVDAHVGYYRERSIVDRLRADVILPAQAQGYRHVWIGGISIGGFGALLYAEAHPEDIDGVIAIAPYLGSPKMAAVVTAAGGLAAFNPPPGTSPPDDLDTPFWQGLREHFVTTAGPASPPLPLFLGYGLADRFVTSDDVLAHSLPPVRIFTAEGDHDWPVWDVLWPRMLAATPLPVDPGCGIE